MRLSTILSWALCPLFLLLPLAACSSSTSRVASSPTPLPDPSPAATAVRSPAVYSPQQLQEDFQILRTTLEEAHPGLYTFASQAERDAQFDQLEAQLDRELTGIEFYRLIAPLVTDIHDGHTVIWPPADSPVYATDRDTFLPFRLRFIDGDGYVAEVLVPDTELARGIQILSINGLPLSDIVARLLPYVPHNAYIETGKLFYLGKLFPLFYGWVFGPAEGFEVQMRDPATGEESIVVLSAINVTEISSLLLQGGGAGANLNLEIRPEGAVAIMTIGSFDDPNIRSFLNDSFAKLRESGIQDLVIDLRGNGGGGSGDGALLYSFLSEEPFRYYDYLGAVLHGPLTFLEHTNQSATGMDSILARMEPTESGALRYPHWTGLDQEQPGRPDAFAGNVYILIDGGCGSSTTEFAAVAQANNRGVFVGEETGGRYYGNNSGTMPELTLPNTGIVVIVPLFQFVMAVPALANDRGIMPDYAVTPTPEDFAAGVDTELAFTLDLIEQNR
jgi:hypothetical protein